MKDILNVDSFPLFCSEIVNDVSDPSGRLTKVKEEEEEIEEQPAAKKRRGKSKSQLKAEPKEEIKSEGNMYLLVF